MLDGDVCVRQRGRSVCNSGLSILVGRVLSCSRSCSSREYAQEMVLSNANVRYEVVVVAKVVSDYPSLHLLITVTIIQDASRPFAIHAMRRRRPRGDTTKDHSATRHVP